MEPIIRGKGATESERYLAQLADAAFLELWCYPNTFIDKRPSPKADGKELCDLLVVFGNDIIIFSDKSNRCAASGDLHLNWSRWYRRAIAKSVDQIRGAERWLRQFPERIFLDAACSRRFPIELPPVDQRRVHGIAIALGTDEACRDFWDSSDGSLMVVPSLEGGAHVDRSAPNYLPFAIGDVDPNGPFVHVLDKSALDLILTEMDTISDFMRYLRERESFIRRKKLVFSPSEAELVAAYLENEDSNGNFVFPTAERLGASSDATFILPEGSYRALRASDYYLQRKEWESKAYLWDRLIGAFTEHILAGTSVEIAGEAPSALRAEPALRIMARENRRMRAALSGAVAELLKTAELKRDQRRARVVLPGAGFADMECGYVFLVLAYPTDFDLEGGYSQYRAARVAMLETYCYSVLSDNRHLKRMVGIALDASTEVTGRNGGSEDLIAVEVKDWTPELERDVSIARNTYDILGSGTVWRK